ncbi:MAG: Ldh family oxidoreductase [Egibacteraceae bacterium]
MTDLSVVRVPRDWAVRLAASILEAADVRSDSADITAEQLVLADLRGVDTHGLMRLPNYIERMRRGELEPDVEPAVLTETSGTATVDGRHGLGQVNSHFAMSLAVDKARDNGVAAVTVRNSSHFGAAAGYPMLATERGCIGIATTNAWPLLPAVGGAARRVGNNPLAIGAPTRLGYPLVLDIAMSHVAAGKLRIAAEGDNVIPPDWAFDKHGNATTDARAALFGGGLLRPMADHKGFALALMMDVLAGVLSGAGYGPSVTGLDEPGYVHVGHFFVALDVAAFMDLECFLDRIDDLAAHVHASPRRQGVDRVLVPGEVEATRTAERLRDGIPYRRDLYDRLLALAADFEVDVGAPDAKRVGT